MHNNYYFIQQLVKELATILPGNLLADAYSQNKDEAILSFIKNGHELHIIAHLTGQFTCLAFPEEYVKAKKNTATIFSDIIGKRVTKVYGFENERALAIDFEENYSLIFKLFGRQSNLLLTNENKVTELFKKSYKSDQQLIPDQLHRSIDQSREALMEVLPDFRSTFPTLHRQMIDEINQRVNDKTGNEAAEVILDYISHLKNPSGYLIKPGIKPSLEIQIGERINETIDSAIEASTQFFFQFLKLSKVNTLKNKLQQEIEKKISKTEVYIAKTRRKLRTIEEETNYKQLADLLMANLHNVPRNTDSVVLQDFYNEGQSIKVKLNLHLSPQQNAERYYRKAKNLKLEIDNLKASIESKEKSLLELKSKKIEIEAAGDIKSLRKHSKSEVAKPTKEVPFKAFIIDGYTVYVGNNAKQNDLLTLKYARKNDLFFHAKDVSGSHVILKERPGSNFPAKVLEATASIAAYYSKRKTDSLCPVGYTEKKYVRKPKGSPAGLVLVDREKVLLVPPQLP